MATQLIASIFQDFSTKNNETMGAEPLKIGGVGGCKVQAWDDKRWGKDWHGGRVFPFCP